MKNFILKITFNIYKIIFHEEISPSVLLFLKNLKHITIGYGIAAVGILVFQILGGRILGPEEYGKYALVDSIAMFLHISMLLGISTAAVKYNAEKEDFKRQKKIISTSYLIILFLSLVSVLFFSIFLSQFSRIFTVSKTIFSLAIIFALFYSLYFLAINSLKGLHEMKKLSVFRIGYALFVLIVFGFFILAKYTFFSAVVLSISFAYFIIFLLITINIRKYLSFYFDKFWAKKFLRYGIYATIGGLSFAFLLSFSKLLVNKFLTTIDVGIYNAYFFSSIGIVIFISGIFTTVFFPTASRYARKEPIFKKIKQFSPYLFFGGTPILFVIEWIILNFYGNEYSINYILMFLFVITSILIIIYQLYNWLFLSEGVLGVKLVTVTTVTMALTNTTLSLYLIPTLGLYGAIISIGISYFIGIIFLSLLKEKLYKSNIN